MWTLQAVARRQIHRFCLLLCSGFDELLRTSLLSATCCAVQVPIRIQVLLFGSVPSPCTVLVDQAVVVLRQLGTVFASLQYVGGRDGTSSALGQ